MKNILLIAALAILAACNKEEDNDIQGMTEDTFIFGHFYGECFGESCVEIFKIEDDKLYEDLTDEYPGQAPYNFEWIELSDDKYQMAKDLPGFFPEPLKEESETTIGIPDAGDWGGFIIGKPVEGELRFWLIDTMKDNIPTYLHEFNDQIELTISNVR